jgi:EAL domain-containing protein (putative c-di-GMP-specific phosphodiesterase class I)
MGTSLKLSVVAEGVETAAQAAWLVDHGCTRLQGYYYARPMGGAAMEAWLMVRLAGAPAAMAAQSD